MKTLIVDDHKRVRIPDAQPKQVFAYENAGGGRMILTLVVAKAKEPFPPGSLKKFITPEFNHKIESLAKGIGIELPE